MSTYIISYDLKKPVQNYIELYGAIKSYGTWAQINESVWAVVTASSAVQIREKLLTYIDLDDRLFVIKSGREAAWLNSICKDEWLTSYL